MKTAVPLLFLLLVGCAKSHEMSKEQRILTDHIKQTMHDPGSYQYVDSKDWRFDDFVIVEQSFRGKNAFGAVVLNTIQAQINLKGEILETGDDVYRKVTEKIAIEKEDAILNEVSKELENIKPQKTLEPSLAGEYWILVDRYYGSDQERYILRRDGSATWEHLQNKKVVSSKRGKWGTNKNEDYISVDIQGNTGMINETYRLNGGKFQSGERSLKRYKPL